LESATTRLADHFARTMDPNASKEAADHSRRLADTAEDLRASLTAFRLSASDPPRL
jgi:hypothetical protein